VVKLGSPGRENGHLNADGSKQNLPLTKHKHPKYHKNVA